MKDGSLRAVGFGGAILAAGLFTTQANVQAASEAASAELGIVEIVVTARRREESAQKVPEAITVVSQQKIEDNNVQTIGELQYLVPALDVSTGLTRDAIAVSIRGQGSSSSSSLPGVVAYLNEVPIPADNDGNLAGGPGLLFDLENVQVLKGPQGTLFGRNSVGGALLLQSARPTHEFGGHLQVGYGNYNNREIDGAINLPINEILLARVAINGQLRDGFTRVLGTPNHPNGIDADNRDYHSVRGTLSFLPSDWFRNDTIITYNKYDSNGSPEVLTAVDPAGLVGSFFGYINLLAQQQALGVRTVLPVDVNLESSGSSLAIQNITTVGLGNDLTFKNLIGYNKSRPAIALDLDVSNQALFDIPSTPRHDKFDQYTEEAQLSGKGFGGRLDWTSGIFVLRKPKPDYVLQTGILIFQHNDTEYRAGDNSTAIYAQGTYDLGYSLKFTGGLRYTWDSRSRDSLGGVPGAICTAPEVNCGASTFDTQASHSQALTWTTSLDYQASPDTLLYIASRRGYRGGGANQAPGGTYGPEFVTDAEVGIKSDWTVGGVPVRTNAATYYQRYSDVQVQQLLGAPSFLLVTANAATARLWGGELEAEARLTRDLTVGASFTKTNFKYTDFGPGVNQATLTTPNNGGRIPYKYGLNSKYRLPLPATVGDVMAQVNWNWQATSGNTTLPGASIPQFGLLNFALNWNRIGGSSFDVSAYVSNATNKVYSVGGLALYNLLGFAAPRFGDPRFYGIRVNYQFGGKQ